MQLIQALCGHFSLEYIPQHDLACLVLLTRILWVQRKYFSNSCEYILSDKEGARLKESWLKVLAICLKSPKGLATRACADKRNGSCCPAEGDKVVDGGRRGGRAYLTLCRYTRATTTTTARATRLQLFPCPSPLAPGTISAVICAVFSLLLLLFLLLLLLLRVLPVHLPRARLLYACRCFFGSSLSTNWICMPGRWRPDAGQDQQQQQQPNKSQSESETVLTIVAQQLNGIAYNFFPALTLLCAVQNAPAAASVPAWCEFSATWLQSLSHFEAIKRIRACLPLPGLAAAHWDKLGKASNSCHMPHGHVAVALFTFVSCPQSKCK